MKQTVYAKLSIFVVLVLAVSCAWAQMPQPFSADFTSTSKNGVKAVGKYYFSPPSLRVDVNERGQNVSMITDGSSQTTYMIMHDQKMYMEMHGNQMNPMARQASGLPSNFDPNNPCVWATAHGSSTCNKVGTEMVNGRLCDKYQGTSKDGTQTGTGWIDQKLHFPIKYVSSDGNATEFSNIKEGKPAASLFQPPAGYQKRDLGSMMGGQRPH